MQGFQFHSGCRRWMAALLLGSSFMGAATSLSSADDTALRTVKRTADSQEITSAVIRSRADEAARANDLDEISQRQIAEFYRDAHTQLLKSDEELRLARLFQNRTDQQRLSRIVSEKRGELERLKSTEPWLPTLRDQRRVEEAFREKDDEVAQLKAAVSDAEKDVKQRADRRNEILKSMPTSRARLDDANDQLDITNTPAEHPLMMLARKTELRTRKRYLEFQISHMELELEAYDQEDAYDLPRLNRYVLYRRLELAEAEKVKLEERHKKYVTDQSKLAVHKAKEEFVRSHPQLKSYAEKNLALAEQAQALSQTVSALEADVKKMKSLREDTDQKFAYVKEKEKTIGQTGAIGLLLRKTRAELPDATIHKHNVAARRELIDDLNFKILALEDELRLLKNIPGLVAKFVAEAPASKELLPEADEWTQSRRDPIAELRAGATFVLERQREYLSTLKSKHNKQYQLLWELDAHEREVVTTATAFSKYIDERVLWIRSGRLLGPWDLENSSKQEIAMFVPSNWSSIVKALHNDFRSSPEITLVALLLFFALLRANRIMARHLRVICAEAAKPTCTDLWLTSQVLGLSVIRSLVFPAVPAFLGWRLFQAASDSTFPVAVSHALLTIAAVGWPMRLVSLLCKHDGLAEAHLNWTPHACDLVRRHMRWMMGAGLAMLFVSVVLDETNRDTDYSVIERLTFIAGMLMIAGFFRRLFKPETGVLHDGGPDGPEPTWSLGIRQTWYYLVQAIPVALAAMSVLGYDYTARQIGWRLLTTSWLSAAFVVVAGVMLRQVMIRHRKLTVQLTGTFPIAGVMDSDNLGRKYYSSSEALQTPRVTAEVSNLNKMLAQTSKLISTMALLGFLAGCWMIWSDIVPALKVFDAWPLWTVEVAQLDGAGKSILVNQPVTIPHVLMAAFLTACTWIAVKNLSGLLDFLLLERLPLDRAARYAINALASYTIMVLGAIVVFGTLGISWSKVQWLATALTFGLAFGLQEVFANFVSGIIILFERPLRIGDVVTIGDVTGSVSKISMRATTISNADRQELIVPNKEFITGRLLNWTLSDEVNRIVITTGVAYGSDADQVRHVIQNVANRHPLLMRDPAPTVTFENFDDSAMTFKLRAFLPEMEPRLQTIHELHTQIYKALTEHGIEMPFPQQDVHIRSLPSDILQGFTGPNTGKQEPPKGNMSRVA